VDTITLRDVITVTRDDDGVTRILYAEDGQPMNSFSVNSNLGWILQSDEAFRSLRDFMKRHGIPEDKKATVDDYDSYSSDSAARYAIGLIREAMPVFSQLYPDNIGYDGFYGFSPVVSDRGNVSYGAQTYEEYITVLFKEYRKDLARVVAEHRNLYAVMWYSAFAGHVPIEWIVKALDTRVSPDSTSFTLNNDEFDRMLSKLNRYQIRRLMNSQNENIYYLAEAARLMSTIPDEHVTFPDKLNPNSMHNHFTLLSKGIKPESPFEIPEQVERIHGMTVAGCTVNVLTSPQDYEITGEVMNNCAGTAVYTLDTLEGKNNLVRFEHDSEFVYLMELEKELRGRWKIRQLFGVSNSDVPEDHKKEIYDLVEREVNA